MNVYIKMSITSSVYFQNITREEAENYVMNNDKIVLRRSYSVPDCFVLTFKYGNSPRHILLVQYDDGSISHSLSGNSNRMYRTYDDLNDLLSNYKNGLPN